MKFAGAAWAALRGKRSTARSNHTEDNTMATQIFQQKSPPAGSIAWLDECIVRGKKEIFTARVLVTPGLANELLNRNPENRNISPTKAEHYARDMAAGRWEENGETIIISRDGLLNDGQHRMQAVIDSNTPITFIIVFGVPRESRITVDQGRARGAGDYLDMLGVKFARNASVAAKFIMAYERGDGKNISHRSRMTNAEVVSRVRSDEDIIKSAEFAWHLYGDYRHLFSHTVMTVCHYLLSEIDPSDANSFLEQVATGENIKRGDPAFAVRQAFLADKRERQDAMEIIFHGWNAFRSNRPLKLAKRYGTLPALV